MKFQLVLYLTLQTFLTATPSTHHLHFLPTAGSLECIDCTSIGKSEKHTIDPDSCCIDFVDNSGEELAGVHEQRNISNNTAVNLDTKGTSMGNNTADYRGAIVTNTVNISTPISNTNVGNDIPSLNNTNMFKSSSSIINTNAVNGSSSLNDTTAVNGSSVASNHDNGTDKRSINRTSAEEEFIKAVKLFTFHQLQAIDGRNTTTQPENKSLSGVANGNQNGTPSNGSESGNVRSSNDNALASSTILINYINNLNGALQDNDTGLHNGSIGIVSKNQNGSANSDTVTDMKNNKNFNMSHLRSIFESLAPDQQSPLVNKTDHKAGESRSLNNNHDSEDAKNENLGIEDKDYDASITKLEQLLTLLAPNKTTSDTIASRKITAINDGAKYDNTDNEKEVYESTSKLLELLKLFDVLSTQNSESKSSLPGSSSSYSSENPTNIHNDTDYDENYDNSAIDMVLDFVNQSLMNDPYNNAAASIPPTSKTGAENKGVKQQQRQANKTTNERVAVSNNTMSSDTREIDNKTSQIKDELTDVLKRLNRTLNGTDGTNTFPKLDTSLLEAIMTVNTLVTLVDGDNSTDGILNNNSNITLSPHQASYHEKSLDSLLEGTGTSRDNVDVTTTSNQATSESVYATIGSSDKGSILVQNEEMNDPVFIVKESAVSGGKDGGHNGTTGLIRVNDPLGFFNETQGSTNSSDFLQLLEFLTLNELGLQKNASNGTYGKIEAKLNNGTNKSSKSKSFESPENSPIEFEFDEAKHLERERGSNNGNMAPSFIGKLKPFASRNDMLSVYNNKFQNRSNNTQLSVPELTHLIKSLMSISEYGSVEEESSVKKHETHGGGFRVASNKTRTKIDDILKLLKLAKYPRDALMNIKNKLQARMFRHSKDILSLRLKGLKTVKLHPAVKLVGRPLSSLLNERIKTLNHYKNNRGIETIKQSPRRKQLTQIFQLIRQTVSLARRKGWQPSRRHSEHFLDRLYQVMKTIKVNHKLKGRAAYSNGAVMQQLNRRTNFLFDMLPFFRPSSSALSKTNMISLLRQRQ